MPAETLMPSDLVECIEEEITRYRLDKKFCGYCHKLDRDVNLQRCSRCKSIRYCSVDCQRQDFKGHKLLCKLFAENKNPEGIERDIPLKRKTNDLGHYRRVIFFHPEKTKPEVIWADINNDDFEKELIRQGHCSTPTHTPFHLITIESPCPPKQGCDDYHPEIKLLHRENFAMDGSLPNKSLAAAARANGFVLPYDWRGPVVLCREYVNISMADYLEVIRFLRRYGTR